MLRRPLEIGIDPGMLRDVAINNNLIEEERFMYA